MNYIEWSNEYRNQEETIKNYLAGLKTELKASTGDKKQQLTGRISTLYSIYLECKHIRLLLEERAERCGDDNVKTNTLIQ